MFRPTPGTSADAVPTPFLRVDLDALEANRRFMAEWLAQNDCGWRPHVKSHRSPQIARELLSHGAIGVTCATLDEAEQMVAGGVSTPLLAHLSVSDDKLARLARLFLAGEPIATCDHFVQAETLNRACRAAGSTARVLVDVDVGMNRVGIRPGKDAQELARAIDRLPNVELVGVMGYEGHLLQVPDLDEKRRRIEEAMGTLCHTRDRLLRDGLRCDVVSAGGTGSLLITPECDGVTEVQAGGGIFGDPFYRENCGVRSLQPALHVVTTVVSRPSRDRAVVDAGWKSVNGDFVAATVRNDPATTVAHLSAEHGSLRIGEESRLEARIGDRIDLVVGYSDRTCVLHTHLVGVRDGMVEDVWSIGGRFRTPT